MNAFLNRLYRMLFCRGGHGVHSPFVFDLITTALEERRPYYCYEQLHAVRLQLLQEQRKVSVLNRAVSVKKAIATCCFTESEDQLLFRLANRFQPKTILTVGSHFGLTPLYLTAFSKDATCIIIESEPTIAAIMDEYIQKYALAPITLYNSLNEFLKTCIKHRGEGDTRLFPKAGEAESVVNQHPSLDFIVWENLYGLFKTARKRHCEGDNPKQSNAYQRSEFALNTNNEEKTGFLEVSILTLTDFEFFLSYIHDQSVMVISGINASRINKKIWKAICVHPKVTVTIDLYRFGIVFFNPAYHQETYKSVVL